MRVCYFGTYRAEYSRNRILIEGLRQNGVEVIECHEPLWHSIEDRVAQVSGGWISPRFWLRAGGAYLRLVWRYLRLGPHDVVVVGYPGQFDVYCAKFLCWLRNRPLVWDVFMSIYLIAVERGLDQKSLFTVNTLRVAERWACRLPDRLWLDTAEYVAWFGGVHGVSAERFRLIPTGADERVFRPVASPVPANTSKFRVVYHGSFIPNHEIDVIIGAADLLRGEPNLEFELIGDGPERAKAVQTVRELKLENVIFYDWLDQDKLVRHLALADICLGVFGSTPQSRMTIQNKIYEGLALAKPVVTGDSPTVRATFNHGWHVYLVPRANPSALAEAIRCLRADTALRAQLAREGNALFCQRFTIAAIGKQATSHLQELLSSKTKGAFA